MAFTLIFFFCARLKNRLAAIVRNKLGKNGNDAKFHNPYHTKNCVSFNNHTVFYLDDRKE